MKDKMTQSSGITDKTLSKFKSKKSKKKMVNEDKSYTSEMMKYSPRNDKPKLEIQKTETGDKTTPTKCENKKRKTKFKFTSADQSDTVTTSDVNSVKKQKLEISEDVADTEEISLDQQESKRDKKQRLAKYKRLRRQKAKHAKLKSKMPREELEKLLNRTKPEISPSQQALNFLTIWNTSRQQWKFNKKNQVWLLKHIYDESEINSVNFNILLKYIMDLRGKSKDETREEANKLMKDQANPMENEVKYKRAVQVLQALDE